MKPGKKCLAGLLMLVLCLSILCPAPVRAADVCFTAINDSVLKLTNESMPIWSDGVLYTPYTTFDATANGVMWSIECSYNRGSNIITVFDINKRQFLEFDLREGTSQDGMTGEEFPRGAILRGGRPYLPVALVCDFFGLRYSYREIDQGTLLRIRSDEAVISETRFPDAAENVLNVRLRDYNQSQDGGESTPAAPNTPQTPSQDEPTDELSVDTYLSFRCGDPEFLIAILTVLESREVKGMFFLTPELIEQRSDLVLWMLGEGHSIGLLAQSDTMEETRRILAEGERALAEQVFLRTTVALTAPEFREELEREGWICWNSTLDLAPGDSTGANYFSSRVLSQLGGRTSATYLSLDVSANALRVLPTLLLRLGEEGYHLRVPLETRL